MGYKEHAETEFLALGYKPISECEDDPNKWIQENVMELLEVFSKQGHSGASAPYCVKIFSKLALFEPLSPITGEECEWVDVGGNFFQNKRCSATFRDGKDGKPYYLNAIIFKTQTGSCYTGSAQLKSGIEIKSRQTIKLPFTPKSFYVDVIEEEVTPDNWIFHVKDESQLEEVFEYYERGH